MSGGVRHSLAVKPDGTVWAWGANSSGQLGDGTVTSRTKPVRATGLTAMKAVAAGYQHSLALGTDGKVFAWGANNSGQLGEATTTPRRLIPTEVTGIAQGVDLAAGLYHSMVLRADGTVWTWGANSYGQLGNGTTANQVTPSQVGGLPSVGVTAVAAGAYHSLALDVDGRVWTWGSNSYGQLGDGTTTPKRSVAAKVPGLENVVAISAGYYHSLALRVDGSVWAWGENLNGQLGDGTITRRFAPVRVTATGLPSMVALSGGGLHSLALGTDGSLWAWGSNARGQLGDNDRANHLTPVKMLGLSNVVALDGGDTHSMAQRVDGSLWAWGDNGYGQVGEVPLVDQPAPVQALTASARGMVTAGTAFSYVLRADGSLWGFGLNDCYQMASTDPDIGHSPVKVTGIDNVRMVSAGHDFVIALRSDGTVWGWGNNGRTQLGDGTPVNRHTPTRVRDPEDPTGLKPLGQIASVSAGFSHVLALRSDGTVWAWGYNDYDQIGDGIPSTTSIVRFVPVKVKGLDNVVAVSAGRYHSLALKADGTVWAWGGNMDGQLGIGSTVAKVSLPVQVPGLSGVAALAVGTRALKADGTVWTWGNNQFGYLGNGNAPVGSNVPVQVPGLDRVVALSDSNGVLALRADGTLWAWGPNNGGQLGTGTTSYSVTTPVRSATLNGLVSIGGGSAHSLVMLADGSVWAWGYNANGQLGDPTLASHLTPFQVVLP
ncbi:hypothetical protein BO221_38790 [Archangium sp. Cb G35]|nr:hypothetical protein BO221_38790 [Archangium sp. Cb G35]